MIFTECAISGKKHTVTDMTFTKDLFWHLVTQREILKRESVCTRNTLP